MKFNLSDFLQLDTKELLAVNGGFNCNGSSNTTVYPNTYYSSTPGGAGSNLPSSSRAVVGSSIRLDGTIRYDYDDGSHLFVYPDGQRQFYPGSDGKSKENNGKDASSSSGGGSCSTSTSNNPNGQGPSTTSSNPGGDNKIYSGGGTCTKTGGHSPVNPNPTNPDDVTSGGGTCTGKDGGKTSSEKIMEQIIAKGDKTGIEDQFDPGEKKGCYVKGSYQCDEYVEEMIRKAGFKPKDYSIDDPSGKTINDHIKDLQASKKNYETDASKLTKGVYVVFMADKEKTLESHAALLFVEEGGGAFMYDNSSHNFKYKDSDGKTAYYGGIERTNGNSAKAVCNQYVGYENFYFQQL